MREVHSFDGERPCYSVALRHVPSNGTTSKSSFLARELVARERNDYCRRCGRETDLMGGHLTEAECAKGADARNIYEIADIVPSDIEPAPAKE